MARILTYAEAIREAVEQEMARNESIVILGLGVTDHKGTYGTTTGLQERFPGRVIETPLSEDAMTGVAIGMAMAGLRPVHVHVRMDFMLLAMNQIVNMAAKLTYMQNGAASVPLVIRGIIGRGWGQGAQHSQVLHSFFAHVPGLTVVAPATPYDAKGCMIRALRMKSPVIFVEHRMLYKTEGHVPEEGYEVDFGTRVLADDEDADVTLVGISYAALQCLRAGEMLKEIGLKVDVINPIGLRPLDAAPIIHSVSKTERLLVVDVGWESCGIGAEIIARVAERACASARKSRYFSNSTYYFDRMGFASVPCPTAKVLENEFYPSTSAIATRAAGMAYDFVKVWNAPDVEDVEIAQFKGPF